MKIKPEKLKIMNPTFAFFLKFLYFFKCFNTFKRLTFLTR